MNVFYTFLLIGLLFLIVIFAKRFIKNPLLCAICIAISGTWISLLILYKLGRFHNVTLLALLMGQSVSGMFYLLRGQVPASLRIFTLPFFLSLTAIFYVLITDEFILPAFGLTSGLWLLTWLVFVYRNDPGRKPLAKAVMDCCGGED